ncbi:hypothetical protein [Sporosalibacterium faouarense]|uniref:hypothetical protein n=1 Tax=Sporosalibacterium faouarense TaxID=516123 RepID=UPI00192BF4FA|nr:hypothetical protein [Sporosalibacterium faouarense]
MKKRADLLINGEYRRINIWDVLHWKQSKPEFWEKNKDYIFSTNKNIEDKVQMVFQTGRNNNLGKSYFRFKNIDSIGVLEGYEETYQHEFFKECFSRLKVLNLKFGKDIVKIYVDEAIQEEVIYTKNDRKRIVDVMIEFSKSEPMIYVEKWNGKLAVEVFQTHKVDEIKIKEFKDMEMAMVEFDASKWKYITDNFQSEEEEEKQFEKIISKLNNIVYVSILSDPISRKYFSSVKLEEEIAKNELYKKELILMKNKISSLKDENQNLLEEIKIIRENEKILKLKMTNITKENELLKDKINNIQSKFLYKLLYKWKK